jgi:hypothetical protein
MRSIEGSCALPRLLAGVLALAERDSTRLAGTAGATAGASVETVVRAGVSGAGAAGAVSTIRSAGDAGVRDGTVTDVADAGAGIAFCLIARYPPPAAAVIQAMPRATNANRFGIIAEISLARAP